MAAYKDIAVRIPLADVIKASGMGFLRLKPSVEQFQRMAKEAVGDSMGEYEAVVIIVKKGERVDRDKFDLF